MLCPFCFSRDIKRKRGVDHSAYRSRIYLCVACSKSFTTVESYKDKALRQAVKQHCEQEAAHKEAVHKEDTHTVSQATLTLAEISDEGITYRPIRKAEFRKKLLIEINRRKYLGQ